MNSKMGSIILSCASRRFRISLDSWRIFVETLKGITMKNIIAGFLVIGFTTAAFAQVKVPESVKTAFAKKFPSATSVKWSEEKEEAKATIFEAEFKLNGKSGSSNFNAAGEWIETEQALLKTDLPAVVIKTIDSQFSGYKMGDMVSVETPSEKSIEIILSKGEEKLEVVLDPSGKVIKKTAVKEEEEEENEENEAKETKTIKK